MDGKTIRVALAEVGEALAAGEQIDILIVGGTAGMLTGLLPDYVATDDVDVMDCHMPADKEAVFDAAERVALTLGLPGSWMSDFAALHRWKLPRGWDERKVLVGLFGRLVVHAVGRQDFITMKLLAHRQKDIDHLSHLRLVADDLKFVLDRFDELEEDHPEERDAIALSRAIVKEWKLP
ncbi:MAG TPA: DUF6036 family nucleotidyltransferase [Tepidisphaeraceae bacterium]|jgi:hypothetical protein|nr:DUF6036 family nucleotidyltransferase [Tepidisphaeraceae bacterium]